MDALSDVLRAVHLSGSLYFRSEPSAPWGMEIPSGDTAQFHILRRGRCFLQMEDSEPILMEAGDMAVFPEGMAHAVVDDPRTNPLPLQQLIEQRDESEESCALIYGGGGEQATLICGYFRFDKSQVHPLMTVLPPMILLRGESGRAQPWLESTLDLIAGESCSRNPGSEILIDRLTETLFIRVIRSFLNDPAADKLNPSWLAGLRDAKIGEALGYIHHLPQEAWTVDVLARRVGMSRSSFSGRFSELVGEPPLKYITRWRMQLAAEHLKDEKLSLAEIAKKVGYQAEAAFSKVFKRMWGVSPGTYRRREAA